MTRIESGKIVYGHPVPDFISVEQTSTKTQKSKEVLTTVFTITNSIMLVFYPLSVSRRSITDQRDDTYRKQLKRSKWDRSREVRYGLFRCCRNFTL